MIEPVRIAPEDIYDDASLRQALGLTATALAAGRRAGALRHTRQGKRTLYKGAWVLEWLESVAEPQPQPRRPCRAADGRGVGQ